jgi:hypothetical protein
LHDLLVGQEAYLRRLETATQHLVAPANYTKTKPSNYRGSQQWSPKQNDNPWGYHGVPAQAEILVALNVMDVVLILAEPTTSIDAISPNAKYVTNLATLQSPVLSFIHRMYLSIVPQPLLGRTIIGYLIRPLHIISRVIFPIYLFIPNMMELMK